MRGTTDLNCSLGSLNHKQSLTLTLTPNHPDVEIAPAQLYRATSNYTPRTPEPRVVKIAAPGGSGRSTHEPGTGTRDRARPVDLQLGGGRLPVLWAVGRPSWCFMFPDWGHGRVMWGDVVARRHTCSDTV